MILIDPITITLAVAGAVNAIFGAIQQNQKAEQVKRDALKARDFSLFQLNQQENQITSAYAHEAAERARQGIRERSMIMVSSGEYGVTGNTLKRLAAVSMTQEDYDTGITRANEMNAKLSLVNERKSLEMHAAAAIANVDASKVGVIPMLAGTALGALQGYQTGQGLSAAYNDSGLALQMGKLNNYFQKSPSSGDSAVSATNVLFNPPQLRQSNTRVKQVY